MTSPSWGTAVFLRVFGMDVDFIIEHLGLEPHPEGGYYRETYRCDERIPPRGLPSRYSTGKSFGTAILYLLTSDTVSVLHRLKSDEVFHFYLGDPVSMLLLYPDGRGEEVVLGNDMEKGQYPQRVVPRHTWQGMMLVDGGSFALMGTTVAPGFDFEDFEIGDGEELARKYPRFEGIIARLTRR